LFINKCWESLNRRFVQRFSEFQKRREIKMVEGYCVKCKAKREMKDPKEGTMKNGRKCVKGTCPKCGTKMFRIGSSS